MVNWGYLSAVSLLLRQPLGSCHELYWISALKLGLAFLAWKTYDSTRYRRMMKRPEMRQCIHIKAARTKQLLWFMKYTEWTNISEAFAKRGTRPKCPVFLLFPERETSFNVDDLIVELSGTVNVNIHKYDGLHGFADPKNKNYSKLLAEEAFNDAVRFLSNIHRE